MKKRTKRPAKEPPKQPQVIDAVDVFAGQLLSAETLGRFGRGEPLIDPKPANKRN